MQRSKVAYTHCYCEENIYKLLETVSLAIEIQRRKKTTVAPSSTEAPVASQEEGNSKAAAETIPLDPREFSAASAVFVATYHEDCHREKKNHWESRFPICTEDVLNLLASGASVRLTASEDVFTLWDYHVIALLYHTASATWYVVDLDTKVGQPPSPSLPDSTIMCVRADLYARISFVPQEGHRRFTKQSPSILSRIAGRICFRVVDAVDFLRTFRSDRTHMLVKRGNGHLPEYNAPPPSYPCITEASPVAKVVGGATAAEELESPPSPDDASRKAWRQESNLASFINMDNTTTVPGRILTRDAFLTWCTSPKGPTG